jgi:hypothetical protein
MTKKKPSPKQTKTEIRRRAFDEAETEVQKNIAALRGLTGAPVANAREMLVALAARIKRMK